MQTQNPASVIASFHRDLQHAKELIYDHCGLECTNSIVHIESTEYAAYSFELNNKKIQHRLSKITPTKIGQFVTIWKRNTIGITEPYDILDGIDFIIITCRKDNLLGQFIFPTSALANKGIISTEIKDGKRGIRIYPPWNIPTSKQTIATQKWQSNFFISIEPLHSKSIECIKKLFVEHSYQSLWRF